MSVNRMIKVGITQGDINGVGYEVILKTLADARFVELCTPVVYGSAKVAAYHRKALEMEPVNFNIVTNAAQVIDGQNNLINCIDEEVKVEIGHVTEQVGAAAYAALQRAVDDLAEGLIDVLVTAPINKHTMQSAEFNFPGHTEYLQERLGGEGDKALMILLNDTLRVALVTGHMPIAQVPAALSQELIVEKLQIFEEALRHDFGVRKPRIAVLSLNPHAGENGLLGAEENDIIIPAINGAKKKGMLCFGPYAADGFFGTEHFKKFDGVLAMYHDQGLAPFKALAMECGVNYTAGLPFVRTSPDHGTAYDIAGKGIASEESFRQAIYTAIDIYRNRISDDEAHASPLRRQYVDKSGDREVLDLTGDDE